MPFGSCRNFTTNNLKGSRMMKFKSSMTVVAFISFLAGLVFNLYGPLMLAFFNLRPFYQLSGEPSSALSLEDSPIAAVVTGLSFLRMFGAMLIGMGLLSWLTRHISNVEAQRSIALGLFVANALGFLVALKEQYVIWHRPAGQVIVITFLLLTLGLGYLRFIRLNAAHVADV